MRLADLFYFYQIFIYLAAVTRHVGATHALTQLKRLEEILKKQKIQLPPCLPPSPPPPPPPLSLLNPKPSLPLSLSVPHPCV